VRCLRLLSFRSTSSNPIVYKVLAPSSSNPVRCGVDGQKVAVRASCDARANSYISQGICGHVVLLGCVSAIRVHLGHARIVPHPSNLGTGRIRNSLSFRGNLQLRELGARITGLAWSV
jgi:hypothetical protein